MKKHLPKTMWPIMIGIILTGCAPPSSGPASLTEFAKTFEKDLNKLEQIQPPNIGDFLKTITEEIPFAGFELSEKGKHKLEEIAEQVVSVAEEFLQQPEQGVTVKIRVSGYTDAAGYRKGGETETELLANYDGEVPEEDDERKQLLNELMSERRATIVYDDIYQRLEPIRQEEEARMQIESQIERLGEELPPEVLPPYPTNDPRRQICIVWVEFTSYAIED